MFSGRRPPGSSRAPGSGNTGGGFGGSGSSGGGWTTGRPGGATGGNARTEDGIDLDTEAPIPGEPSLYSEGDVFHVARVTFTVKLVNDEVASPDA